MNKTPPIFEPGDVVDVICFHEDSVDEIGVANRLKDGKTERVVVFWVDGKFRPCLILCWHATRYYRVWKLSCKDAGAGVLESLNRLDRKTVPSYLRDPRRYPNEIVWIHEQLAQRLIGEIDKNEYRNLYDQVRGHNGYGPPIHVGQTNKTGHARR